jgi:hypothetical protein
MRPLPSSLLDFLHVYMFNLLMEKSAKISSSKSNVEYVESIMEEVKKCVLKLKRVMSTKKEKRGENLARSVSLKKTECLWGQKGHFKCISGGNLRESFHNSKLNINPPRPSHCFCLGTRGTAST